MSTHDELMAKQRAKWREEEKRHRALWASLTPEQREPFERYIAGRPEEAAKLVELSRSYYLNALEARGLDSGAEWVAKSQQKDRDAAARDAEWEAQKRARREERDARIAVRRAAVEAAIASGEPVPAHLRPVGGRCAACRRFLRDPESVRMGIGPECRKVLK